ncbi:MAG TPA: hypothetical protein VMX13_00850 [Sedimentisphaerales bacterium]|nr:hypothetical protein [Sedimentisphaerales bacterium]
MMEESARRSKTKRGAVLALAVAMVVILAIIGLVLIRLGSDARVRSARATTDMAARAAADAGLTQAVRLMNNKLINETVWDNSTLPSATDEPLPGNDATFSFNVEGNQNIGFLVASTGKSGFDQRTVYTRLNIESMWVGIGVREYVDVLSKTIFDTIPAGGDFCIRTNSIEPTAVKLFPGTYVPGDIIIGPGGDTDIVVDTKKSSIIDGDVYAAAEEITFPEPVVPPLPYIGSLPAADGNGLIKLTSANSGIYDSINLGQGQKLHIVNGDVQLYVTGEVRLHQGSELLIVSNATFPSLDLYLGGNMQADQGSLIITEDHINSGTRFKLFGTEPCSSIILMNSGDLSAAIYAPSADVEIKNSGATYGAFTANSIVMKNSGSLTYDTRLLDVDINDQTAYLGGRWWED